MSTLLDETAADVPVRDITVGLSRLAAGPPDPSMYQNAGAQKNISQASRRELEDRFLCLQEETLLLKQHNHKQNDKIKKLATKLMKLEKDRRRMEQLAVGGARPVSRVRDVEMEEMMEELQEKVRRTQMENEKLKQRLLVEKQQLLNSQSRRATPYDHIPPRVNSGLKKLRDDASSPSQARPKSSRSLEGAGRPPTSFLPRFGHNLLEEARAEIRNLKNVIDTQQTHVEELRRVSEQLKDDLKEKEEEYEERLLHVRQQQNTKVRSYIGGNVIMFNLQKQLEDRSNVITELEGRFLQLQESQQTLRTSHDAAMAKVDELAVQLKNERLKSLDLENRLQSSAMVTVKMEQMQQRIGELEQERDLLKESNDKLVNSTFDVSRQQKWQIQEQQLRLQIVQLETALNADLVDKNEILDKIKAERDTREKLTEENQKLHLQFLEQKQQLEELNDRLRFYSRENEYDVAELTEALLLIKSRKNDDLSFLREVEEGGSSVQELQVAHAETIQELQKTRNLLSMESKICKDYKAETAALRRKTDGERVELEQKLERQAQLLDARAAKISKLEAQLRDIAYGHKSPVFKAHVTDPDDNAEESLHLEQEENLLELQIIGSTLSPSALDFLGDAEPSTFCTYAFYVFDLHSTPVVTAQKPRYRFTSKYVLGMDDHFLDYVHRRSVTVEMHQVLGLDWRTVAVAQLQLKQLLKQEGQVHGTVPLVGAFEEAQSFGSLDYWMRLRIPMKDTFRLRKPVGSSSSSWNELHITVQRCRGLRSSSSEQPSPYVVYKFAGFSDYPTATVHDCCDPHFNDLMSYSVLMDAHLEQYLKSTFLQFYVFDYEEEQNSQYVGKAGVLLLALTQGGGVAGTFELTDSSGLPAGHIDVTLRWEFPYLPRSAAKDATSIPKEKANAPKQEDLREEDEKNNGDIDNTLQGQEEEEEEEEEANSERRHPPTFLPEGATSLPLLPTLRQKAKMKEGLAAKRVTFVDPRPTDDSHQVGGISGGVNVSAVKRQPSPVQPVLTPSMDGEEDEESHQSEGQLVPVSTQSCSDDSDMSEAILEDVMEASAAQQDQSDASQSDSDECIVQGAAAGRKPSERIRVNVLSLSLTPEGRVEQDSSVVRLFVDYSLLDLPTEETPLSLPKPPPGKSINYNYSKVIPVDPQNYGARRRLLREVLRGRNSQMERIRFTVVSEPPEEEEQDRDCEDVGVAFLRIPEILEKQQDLIETSLDVMDVEDGSEVVASLTVSVEGLEALQDIMKDRDQDEDRTPHLLMR
ncbi:protein fantom [Brachionichthys hirsutus]|uniref:protein fantom n=1 Tax=Brachionichthys hirsutus TaxID=412623 RepID=UPI0036051251